MEELTPITRREVFLAKASGQEVETPTPVTREEVFLDAIANGSGSSLPQVTSSDNGKVLTVVGGNWTTVGKDINLSNLANTRIQPIPILYNPNPGEEELTFTVELTPKDIIETGYPLSYEEAEEEIILNIQPEAESSYAVAYIYTSNIPWYYGVGVSLLLADNAANVNGTIFQTGIFDLSSLGFMDMVGYLVLQPEYGYDAPYRCHLIYWEAQMA